jgi:parallel beta-helix repeat protein
MNWLHSLRVRRWTPHHRRPSLRLERLERRDVPSATLFVVPLSAPTDGTHFHDLGTALGAAATNDTIQIEPNSAPGGATVSTLVTIQGDPASTPGSLPQLGDLTIAVSDGTLTNLNLHNVIINGGVNHTTISSSLAALVAGLGGSGNGFLTLKNNVFTDAVSLIGNTSGATNDLIENNVFARQTQFGFAETLGLAEANGTVIEGNTMTETGFNGITVAGSTGVIIRNNTIRVGNGAAGNGIYVIADVTGVSTSVTITDNVIKNPTGNGILIIKGFTGGPLSVFLSGNDLVNNLVGVNMQGDGTSVGTIDLGGGSLGSAGNNDFHLFDGKSGHFAIVTSGASGDTIQAQNNLFTGTPSAAINAPGETVNATSRTANTAFIQRLFEVYLHRAAGGSDLNTWLPMMANGRQAVINGISHSQEAETVLVDGLYQRLLGRTAIGDSGAAGWIQALQSGMTEEQVVTSIVSSTEFYYRGNALVNSGTPDQRYVVALYRLVLGRQTDPPASEIAGWVSALPSMGRAGLAQALLGTAEFRQRVVTALYFADPTLISTGAYPSIPVQWVGGTLPDLLHRSTAPAMSAVNGWVNSGLDVLSIEAALAASDEFFSNG